MFGLWLYCDKHIGHSWWVYETNHWGPRTIIQKWLYGYRRFSVSREPKSLH